MPYEYNPLYRPQHSNQRKKHPKLIWIVGCCIIILSLFFLVKLQFNQSESITINAKASQTNNTPDMNNTSILTEAELVSKLKNMFEGTLGTYSIYVYDLKTNHGYGINEKTVFTAASVAKIPILAGLYQLASHKDVNLDDTITLQKEDIQDSGTGTLRYAAPGTVYSIKTLARLMMEKSDNTAAYIIGRNIIGFSKLQIMVSDWGLTQTDMENNKTSPYDMSLLMTKIYRGEIAGDTLTKEMLGFMSDTDFEDRIPAMLPKDISVYHKTGDGVGNMHDMGIVELPNHPYVVGIFGLDLLKSEGEVKKTMASASKMIFDYQNFRK